MLLSKAYAVINMDPDTIDWFAGYVICTTGGVSSKLLGLSMFRLSQPRISNTNNKYCKKDNFISS